MGQFSFMGYPCPQCATCQYYKYVEIGYDGNKSSIPHKCTNQTTQSNAYELYGKNECRYGYGTTKSCQAYAGNSSSSGGCYIATAVYGSYNCPQVWLLRRYRDYGLARCILGRLFIRAYYAISPTLVKWFGNNKFFKNLWREVLDCKVQQLRNMGIEDTPYVDTTW